MSSIKVIERILKFGKKQASYKFALLLGIVDYIVENPLEPSINNFHFIPLIYIAKQYLAYYFPLIKENVPQGTSSNSNLGIAIANIIQDFINDNQKEKNFNFSIEPSESINLLISYIDGNNPLPDSLLKTLYNIRKKIIEQPLKAITTILNEKVSFFSIISKGESFDSDFERHRIKADKLTLSYIKKAKIWDDLLEIEIATLVLSHQEFIEISNLRFWLRDVIIKRWVQECVEKYSADNVNMISLIDNWKKIPERDAGEIQLYRKLYTEMNYNSCFYCGKILESNFQIDHFLPWSRYPVNRFWNLYPTCIKCNSTKLDKIPVINDSLKTKLEHHIETCISFQGTNSDIIQNDIKNFYQRKKNPKLIDANIKGQQLKHIIQEIESIASNLLDNLPGFEIDL